MRRLYPPQPVSVRAGGDGVPLEVASKRVAAVREEWLVEDSWWDGHELRRRYFELVLEDGSDVVVFHELGHELGQESDARWFRQRA